MKLCLPFVRPGTAAAVAIAAGNLLPPAAVADEVLPGQGITFQQVDFTFDLAPLPDSDVGEIQVEIVELQLASGLASGYVNVETFVGWSVQNLPIFPDYPYPTISVNFDLGTIPGIDDLSELDAFVDYSPTPTLEFAGGPFRTWPIGEVEFNAGGENGPVGFVASPDPPGTVSFQASGIVEAKFQPSHPLLQTAHNQCLPAAVATSLQWLDDNHLSFDVPDAFLPGLGTDANADGEADDGTLVGQLDLEMGRNSTSRTNGSPTGTEDGLRGKLRYLGNRGLADDLDVKHMGFLGGGDVTEFVFTPTGLVTATSTGLGDTVTFDRLYQEICDGEDVELGFLYEGGGGHRVEVLGAGRILGVPFVVHQSDYKQSNRDNLPPPAGDGIPDNEGLDRADFSFLVDTDMDGRLNLVYNKQNANVHSFFSQSPKEDPIFSDGFESGDVAAWTFVSGGGD